MTFARVNKTKMAYKVVSVFNILTFVAFRIVVFFGLNVKLVICLIYMEQKVVIAGVLACAAFVMSLNLRMLIKLLRSRGQ